MVICSNCLGVRSQEPGSRMETAVGTLTEKFRHNQDLSLRLNNKVLLPISWEKVAKDSRVQGFKCLFFNRFISK